MKRKRYTEPQIVFALQQAESGTRLSQWSRPWLGGVALSPTPTEA